MERKDKYDNTYFERLTLERDFYKKGLLRPDQTMAIAYAYGLSNNRKALWRSPRCILSIGCGRGELEAWFFEENFRGDAEWVEVTGTDIADNRHTKNFKFHSGDLSTVDFTGFDTVIMCESLEHIPKEEFDEAWPRIVRALKETNGRFIVTNWRENHPILPDGGGWDHVREVNDELYDQLSMKGEVAVRDGSHLVIDFKQ